MASTLSKETDYRPLLQEGQYHDDMSNSTETHEEHICLHQIKTPWWKRSFALHVIFLLLHFCIVSTFTLLLIEKFTFHACLPPTQSPVSIAGGPEEWLIECMSPSLV